LEESLKTKSAKRKILVNHYLYGKVTTKRISRDRSRTKYAKIERTWSRSIITQKEPQGRKVTGGKKIWERKEENSVGVVTGRQGAGKAWGCAVKLNRNCGRRNLIKDCE